MAKGERQSRRIEAVFERIGLGNVDPERLIELLDAHERAMTTAERARTKKRKKKFKDVLETAGEKPPEEES